MDSAQELPAFGKIFAVIAGLVLTVSVVQAQTFTVLHNFTGGQDGAEPAAGLTIDRAGAFYGTTFEGGNQACGRGCGTVFKFTHKNSSWILTPLYSFALSGGGYNPGARVVIGPDGALYGTTTEGGTGCPGGCGTVYVLRPPLSVCSAVSCPWIETTLYAFQGNPDGQYPTAQVTFDQAGHILGTTIQGGADYGTVYELTKVQSHWTESVIHSFNASDGFLPGSELTPDGSGNFYGTTQLGGANNEGTVYEMSPSGSGWIQNVLISFPAGSIGLEPYAGVVFDHSGNLYGSTVMINDAIVFELTSLGGSWSINTLYSFGGPFGSADAGPHKTLTMDAAGNLYGTTYAFGPHQLGTVFKLTRSGGNWIYTDLHDFTGGSDGGGPQSEVTLDANGNLYGTTQFGGTNNYGVIWEINPN